MLQLDICQVNILYLSREDTQKSLRQILQNLGKYTCKTELCAVLNMIRGEWKTMCNVFVSWVNTDFKIVAYFISFYTFTTS